MTVARKILFSFLLSVVIFAVVAIIAASSVFIVFAAVFLTLFLTIFFCFNLQLGFSLKHIQKAILHQHEKIVPAEQIQTSAALEESDTLLEELEAAEDTPLMDNAPKAITANQSRTSNVRLAFGDDDIPYLVESSGLELVDGDINEVIRFMKDAAPVDIEDTAPSLMLPLLNDETEEAAELEDMPGGGSLFIQPFAFSFNNPKLLQDAGSEVIYEQDGIHYISSDVIGGENAAAELNIDFAQLVESVVNK